MAFDAYGNGRTVVRGDWGAYRFHDSYNDGTGPLSTSTGSQSFAVPSGVSCTYNQISNLAADQGKQPLTLGRACISPNGTARISPFTIYALDAKDDQQPVTYNWNATLDQQMPWNMNLELSYVGNSSQHTFTAGNLSNQNYIPLGALFQPDPLTGKTFEPGNSQQNQQDYRPYPNYNQVFVPNHIGYGNYNGLQASLNRQKGKLISESYGRPCSRWRPAS